MVPNLLLSIAYLSLAMQGMGTITGRSPTTWSETGLNVIVAQVLESDKGNVGNHFESRAVLMPVATLAGALDPTDAERLVVRFFAETIATSIPKRPEAGDLVLAVVFLGGLHADETEPSNWIPSDYCNFMPDRAAMVILDGMGDERILQVAENLRTVRKAAREAAEKQPRVELSDVDQLRRGGATALPLPERLHIAATSTEPEALRLLANANEPLQVHVLLALNPHTPQPIVEAYRKGDHPIFGPLAEWNLKNRTEAPTTRRAEAD